ncbi:calcium-binding protein, partial [Acinetobacter venetianus]
ELGQNDYILLVNPITNSDRKNIAFGLGGKDTIYGASAQDYLFGGIADDELYGKDGADYLYGGLDNDKLYGGVGKDRLDAASGNDILDGGEDDDILVDESGNDTYIFNGNFGHDTIYDVDGTGQIKINGMVLEVGEKINNKLWKSADGLYIIALVEDFDGVVISKKLVIRKEDDNNSITIKYFVNGALGLTLVDIEDVTNPPEDTAIYAFGTDGNNIIFDQRYVASFAGNDFIHSTSEDAVIIAGDGNDLISTGEGDDIIYAGVATSSNDKNIIMSGAGSDQVYGGTGRDIIITSAYLNVTKQSILNDLGNANSGTTELN